MKTHRLLIPVLISLMGLAPLVAGEIIYFLVGPAPGSPAKDSFVIPLFTPEDVAHARDLIVRGPNPGGVPNGATVGATVGGGRDGINRDFLDPTFPEWSWHVEQAGFGDVFAMDVGLTTPVELEALFAGAGGSGTASAVFWNYTVVRELGARPLFLSIVTQGQNLEFYWSGLGTNFVYALESKDSLASTNWAPVPGAVWPLKTNHWTLPQTNANASFFRVKAEASR